MKSEVFKQKLKHELTEYAVNAAYLAIVFAVTGLWHGAALSFIVWGCYHGALVIVERLMGVGTTDAHCRFWPLRRALTFVLVLLGWVIFRAIPETSSRRSMPPALPSSSGFLAS